MSDAEMIEALDQMPAELFLGGALDANGWSVEIDAVSPYPVEFRPKGRREVATDKLVAGMTILKPKGSDWEPDFRLKELIVPGPPSCRGLHFRTMRGESICYLPGGRVMVIG